MLKKILPFTGVIAAVLAVVAMILMMATPVMTYTLSNTTTSWVGTLCIFGGEVDNFKYNAGWAGTLGWILVLVAVVALCAAVVLQFVLKKYPQIGSILAIVAGAALILGGIFMFVGKTAFYDANNFGSLGLGTYSVGAGWVIGGIVALVGGAVALINCVLGLVASLKK